MPEGVEHKVYMLTEADFERAFVAVMPEGVEHTDVTDLLLKPAASVRRRDAGRR